MTLVKDLEETLEAIASSLDWRAVMHYEHGRLTGISMGTTGYIEESTGIEWEQRSTVRGAPRLRIVRDEQ